MLFPRIQTYFDSLDDRSIPEERLKALNRFRSYILEKLDHSEIINLTFICTHNSRRSHLGQVWAQVAAHYWGVPRVRCYSGGTEATACHPNTLDALTSAGLAVKKTTEGENPVYELRYSEAALPIVAFSKLYDQAPNPTNDFAAIMTCDHAEKNCPYISGAQSRIAITYADPKEADGTPLEKQAYEERSEQIAAEMRYVFSNLPV
ncbi:arsenate-mycothiol transferase ArsC [Persicitalea jodogahamensis]|uniref:Arsenate reductase n=1 Tax=Persicitalea jodogahamensis TaxID=402147 RepID=A0A8J3GB67_9BACT|nr:protein-tyrosine-phosphatase [Persicitalea jodogahamensis]GHB88082.1 arsenate reductase [Persicitalea jodogahamensis]